MINDQNIVGCVLVTHYLRQYQQHSGVNDMTSWVQVSSSL